MSIYRETAQLLRRATALTFIIHPKPDGDAIGAALALSQALGDKSPKIVCQTKEDSVYSQLLGPLKLFDTLPRRTDTLVILDAPDLRRTGFGRELAALSRRRPVAVIDHHQRGNLEKYSNVYLHNPKASSTCELVAELLGEMRIPITPSLATALLLGLYTDTGAFQHANTSSNTLLLAARLVRRGGSLARISELFAPSRSLLKTRLWGHIISGVKINKAGIVFAKVTQQLLTQVGASESDAAGLATYLSAIDGTKAALVLVETEGGWRGTLRSRDRSIDVGELAKNFGGNGSKKVAGFLATEELISGKLEDVV